MSISPKICAMMHCDKHVRKMILEYAQMLCSAHHVCGNYKSPDLYKIAFKNNPCTVWARTTTGNYLWLYNLFINLCKVNILIALGRYTVLNTGLKIVYPLYQSEFQMEILLDYTKLCQKM